MFKMIDKGKLAAELVNDRMNYMGSNTDHRYWLISDIEYWDELYLHFMKIIERAEK